MLRNVTDLRRYAIGATDGVIGGVDDLYFDDEDWVIRYFTVDTGTWLSGRKVLISPHSIGHPDWQGQLLPVTLTKAQVENSPDIDTRKPVSRQHEGAYLDYYGYSPYWGGGGLWGMGAYPGGMNAERQIEAQIKATALSTDEPEDTHLRSCRAVIGYHVHATDGDIGHVEDFLIDEQTWAIRYLIVATSNWWGGHQVLIAPQWIKEVSWAESKVAVDLNRHAVKDAPPYDASSQLERQQEQGIYEHYGLPDYWTTTAIRDAIERRPEDLG